MDTEDTIAENLKLRQKFKSLGVSFLDTEVDIGLACARAALHPGNSPEWKLKNQTNAQKAYDTFVRLRKKLALTEADLQKIQDKVLQLESSLGQLRQSCCAAEATCLLHEADSNSDKERGETVSKLLETEERMRLAEDALLKAEKLTVVGRMAASIAHEINNPLSTAMELVRLAQNADDIPQHIKESLEIANQELNRAAQIARSTLTFFRESPTPVRTNLLELTESVLLFQQSNIRKAGVQLEKGLIGSQPICAFPGELRQILTNLVSNAVEAMRSGGKLVVRVHPARNWRTGEEGYRILVADTGPGISPESRKKLFEPFYTTKGEEGTGLGLWITSHLVQKHRGSIQYRSRCVNDNQKDGSIFSVWLPLTHDFDFATSSEHHGGAITLTGD
jgi:signal transduction histidine kinase